MKRYCLPDELRGELRKPYGELYSGNGIDVTRQIINALDAPAKIIAVGDIVTFNLLSAGVIPDISFVDGRTKRSPASDTIMKGTKHPRFKTVTVNNPAGLITVELLEEISKSMESDMPVRIFVDGEEDLAALPAITMSPVSSVIIYGLPDEGAVLVRVTEEKKKEIQSLLDKMKCMEEK
ncbi:MAG: GTP-dependent dephospho-CoA kinase family protein [Candidatus Methanoperedens sp.]|nr:GTP-dependent dephospho-CoA kinase family protein [Candidatus Methanoperedens sp.]